jgi:hypothetical protein
MNKTASTIAGALAAIWLASPTPSAAQGIEFGPGGIRVDPGFERSVPREVDRREAARIARGLGMQDVEEISATGRRWRVEGVDRRGRDMLVIISRVTGEVLDVSRS